MMNMDRLGQTIYSMPVSTKATAAVLSCSALSYFVYAFFGTKGMMILLVGALVVSGVLGLYGLLIRGSRKRRAESFKADMRGQGAATPQGLNQAGQIAMLDDLRKKFEEGLDKFRGTGKDFYSLPWYVLVGEPGSGKTEAIRHSNIGFPPGLQDELQGVGGTINMNWWFTNDAVILDLAGRLMFSDVNTGDSSEWNVFLKLLRKHRPNCPINGLLLVIPADSLIKDSPETIQRKATKISQQLNNVQRALDVRFPVFVVVTKCDLVLGFREFFDDIDSPDLQSQMFGWSNPDSIDQPFNPELTEKYLAVVKDRLLRRRLTLLQNPEPSHDLSDSRFDEVDTLFDFPVSFEGLLPSLKRYMQTIFVPSEWSTKPLFLRGIYFNSSMREGAALDAELAKVLGIEPESLPEGRIWERDRAFFLRDVFLGKIFPERGLVTRASNVRRLHLQRRLLLLGSGAAGVLLLFLLTWLGGRQLQKNIGRESQFWKFAAKELVDPARLDHGLLLVGPGAETNAPGCVYRGANPVALEIGKVTLSGYHRELQELIRQPLRVPRIFRMSRPFDPGLNAMRFRARRVLFDLGVFQPAVAQARARLQAEAPGGWTADATVALGELLRIEADAAGLAYPPARKPEGRLDLGGLFRYTLSADDFGAYRANDESAQREALTWSYTPDGGGGAWPPGWLLGGATLSSNKPLDYGVQRFIEHCTSAKEANDLDDQLRRIKLLWELLEQFEGDMVKRYSEAEKLLVEFLTANIERFRKLEGFQAVEPQWRAEYEKMGGVMERIQKSYGDMDRDFQAIAICRQADASRAYALLVSNLVAMASERFNALPLPEGGARLRAATAPLSSGPLLHEDVRARMVEALRALRGRFPEATGKDLSDFVALYLRVRGLVGGYGARFPGFAPVVVPDKLKIRDQHWSDWHGQLRDNGVADRHFELEKLCRQIDRVFTNYAALVAVKEPAEDVRRRAVQGVANARNENYGRKCGDVMQRWNQLQGQAVPDRDSVLDLEARAFVRDYLVNATPQDDYVGQHWEDLVHACLKAMADDVIAEVDKVLPQLDKYARFPLDLPKADSTDLSLEEVTAVAALLKQVTPRKDVPDGRRIADGARTELARMDQQLERLRQLQLAKDTVTWINAANRLVDCLPRTADRALTCQISLLPTEDQLQLLRVFGKQGMSDSIMDIWTRLELHQGGAASERFRTAVGEAARVGFVNYPGDPVQFLFFTHHSDTIASRTVSHPGPWGVLHMLHAPVATISKADPKRWTVQVVLQEDSGRERWLWLDVQFSKELPPKAEWPRKPAVFRRE